MHGPTFKPSGLDERSHPPETARETTRRIAQDDMGHRDLKPKTRRLVPLIRQMHEMGSDAGQGSLYRGCDRCIPLAVQRPSNGLALVDDQKKIPIGFIPGTFSDT